MYYFQYLHVLIKAVTLSLYLQLLQEGKKLVLEQIVTTTATVADTVEECFVPYYDLFMPSLKYIMANAVSKEHRLLRGKTIECISLIGLAVGQEKVSVPQRWWSCDNHMKDSCSSIVCI